MNCSFVVTKSENNSVTVGKKTVSVGVDNNVFAVSVGAKESILLKSNINKTIVSNIAGSIIIGGGGSGYMYKTSTDIQLIRYDEIKNVYFTYSNYKVEGDLISLLIIADDEDIEVIGNINIEGLKIEFQCDFDATSMTARMKYLRIA